MIDNLMQGTERHGHGKVQESPQNAHSMSESSGDSPISSSNMPTIVLHPGSIQDPCTTRAHDHTALKTNGTTTPLSARSSFSTESGSSSTSISSQSKHSSLKSGLKAASNNGRKSSPSTVRFAEPEPLPRSGKKPMFDKYEEQRRHWHNSTRNGHPNPLLQYQHRPALTVPISISKRHSLSPRGHSIHHLRSASNPQIPHAKPKATHRNSAPVHVAQPDARWSAIPLPEGFPPPRPDAGSRVASFQSVDSTLSVQSAPPAIPSTITDPFPSQYNPLEHYIPCIEPGCKAHYTPAHAGPTYYMPQGPYSIPRHHGYCLRHAAKEHKEASAICKREYEISRQNCGRKTLGQIAQEFDLFLENFRSERKLEDADLQQQQKTIVLSEAASKTKATTQSKSIKNAVWDWRYTPRPCAKISCDNAPYSPFANHLYSFYTSIRPSNLLPLHNFCPSCAKTEIEAFEKLIQDKWASKPEWDESEWTEWFDAAIKDRNSGLDTWESEQERRVKSKGPVKWTLPDLPKEQAESKAIGTKKGKRLSVFKKLFTITV